MRGKGDIMGKTAFMFPGQGAQYTGMGRDFYENFDRAKEVFGIANKVSGMSMEKLIFTENEELHITKYTQVAMLTVELAILKVLQEKGGGFAVRKRLQNFLTGQSPVEL